VGATLVETTTGEIPPAMVQVRLLRMRGTFPVRPAAIAFDLMFRWLDGWQIEGIAIHAMNVNTNSLPR
jgi:hypothetical protein